jgi:BASS family bile acid:Na+ symporter
MTAASTLAALVMTPVNLSFWGGLHPETADLVRAVALEPAHMLLTVGLLLAAPVALGLSLGQRFPALAAHSRVPVRVLTLGA